MFEALFQSSCKYEVPLKLNLRILVVPIQKKHRDPMGMCEEFRCM